MPEQSLRFRGLIPTMTSRILIVDDEKSVLFVLRSILERAENGYEVATASSGTEALERNGSNSFDLIITDMLMPEMDGVTLTEKLRSSAPKAAIVWMTAHGCEQFVADGDRLGVYRCVDKPLEIHQLRQLAREALESIES